MPRKPPREARKRRPKAQGQAEQGSRSGQDAFAKILAKADPQAPKRKL